jgi:hypothetical protein
MTQHRPRFPLSLYERNAATLLKSGEVLKAEKLLKAVLKVSPRVYALRKLIDIDLDKGNINSAINYIGMITSLYPATRKHYWVERHLENIQRYINTFDIIKSHQISKRPRVAIISAVWGRPILTAIFIKYLKYLILNIDSVSETRAFLAYSEAVYSDYNDSRMEFIFAENWPLSNKWQTALDKARDWHPDLILILGSDDFLSLNSLNFLIKKVTLDRFGFVGFKGLYIAEARGLYYWAGYNIFDQPHRQGEPVGAGRAIAASTMDRINWDFWRGTELSKGLDKVAMAKIEASGFFYSPYIDDLKLKVPVCRRVLHVDDYDPKFGVLDVKSSNNITDTSGLSSSAYKKIEGDVFGAICSILQSEVFARELHQHRY